MNARIEATAIERSRWLAELAEALEQAQKVAWRLGDTDGRGVAAMELYSRLEAARLEVQSLQLKRFVEPRAEFNQEWIGLVPWESNKPERAV